MAPTTEEDPDMDEDGNDKPAPKPSQKPADKAAPTPDPKDVELVALRAKADKLEAAESDRKKKEKTEADNARVEDGKSKEVLAEKQKELDGVKSRLEAIDKTLLERARVVFDSLPEPNQKKLAKRREGMGAEAWLEFVEDEKATLAPGTKTPAPPSPGGPAPRSQDVKEYEPSPNFVSFLDDLGRSEALDSLKGKVFLEKPHQEYHRFGISFKDFRKLALAQRDPSVVSNVSLNLPSGSGPAPVAKARRGRPPGSGKR